MSLITLLGVVLCVSLSITIVIWLASLFLRDASIIDPYWGLGFVILSWTAAGLTGHWNSRTFVILAMVTAWGLRLSLYLLWRNAGKGEDRRYTEMRDKHGDQFWWVSLFTVFLLQGFIMWFVAMPLIVAIQNSESMPGLFWLDFVAIGIWAVGLFFEAVGDFQMARFKSRPDSEGKVMNEGLWRYTRHPNYFGDTCIWWGHYLFAVAAGAWWTVLSPIVMTFFLLKVSGVAMLEKDISDRRPAYQDYIERTNAFVPGPPKAG